jgi:hypothetical protein
MPIYQVNCPHCLENTTHEAADKVQAAQKHVENGRHGHLKTQNDMFRGAGIPVHPRPGPDTSEFNHGKEHNG